MSSATVATIACLALVGAAGMAVWVALQQRRTDELARSLTARKWDIVTLRAELGALRRQMQGVDHASAEVPAEVTGDVERPIGMGDNGSGGGEPGPDPGSPVVASRAPGPAPSPTAWRRDRARGATARPRRRRLF